MQSYNKEQIVDTVIDRYEYDSITGNVFSYATNSAYKYKPLGNINRDGYICAGIRINNKSYCILIHRLAWRLHYGEWPKQTINHKNGIKTDNRIENLEDISKEENNKHAAFIELYEKGENRYNAKLNKKLVYEIRDKFLTNGYTLKKLSEEYNVNSGTIYYIVNNKRWIFK